MTYIKHITLLMVALALYSCRESKPSYPPQEIVPLYEDIAAYCTLDSAHRAGIRVHDNVLMRDYMAVLECDHLSDSLMLAVSRSAPVQVFTPDVRRVYPSLDTLQSRLGHILGAARAAGLSVPTTRYGAVVWGRPQSVVFVDSTMLIALNHYLGTAYPGYRGMPAYRRAAKTPAMLPYDLAESLVANAYPLEGADDPDRYPTLLARMIYEGALTEAKLRLVPDATLDSALGYSPEQLKWLADNEARLWRALVRQQLLYDVSPFVAERILLPSPATELLNRNSPGRAGRYIGYRIVRAYLDRRPDTPLAEMLKPGFYAGANTLADSGYAPQDR